MKTEDRQRMIRLLKLQISNLNTTYAHLLNETGKFSQLKDIRNELKSLELQLQRIEKHVSES